jgi:hypothetical protein
VFVSGFFEVANVMKMRGDAKWAAFVLASTFTFFLLAQKESNKEKRHF